jgi:hypothetical protein
MKEIKLFPTKVLVPYDFVLLITTRTTDHSEYFVKSQGTKTEEKKQEIEIKKQRSDESRL